MKTILFIRTRPLESNTSSSIRALSTIQMLVNSGWNITLLTTDIPVHSKDYDIGFDESIFFKIIRIPNSYLYSQIAGSIKYGKFKKVKILVKKAYNKFRILDSLKECVKNLDLIFNQIDQRYDIIISCSDPKSSHYLANEIINRGISFKKYVQIWGDPIAVDISKKYIYPQFWIRKVEERLLVPADLIFYVSPFTLDKQKELFPNEKGKMELLLPVYRKKIIGNSITKIQNLGYFGDYHSNIRNILPLVEAINKLNLNLFVYGDSDIEIRSSRCVQINKRISVDAANQLENKQDLLICIGNLTGTQIPGKIYNYAATNKPVLIIDEDGRLETFFKCYNRFYFCRNNEKDIVDAIFLIKSRNNSSIMPSEEFSGSYQADELNRKLTYDKNNEK